MNINLSAAAAKRNKKKKQGGGKIQYGLNSRGTRGGSVFDNDNDSDDSDSSKSSNNNNGIGKVNRDLASQQAALRKKLETSQVQYDFDGSYQDKDDDDDNDKNRGAASLSIPPKKSSNEQPPRPKNSRYVGDLLKAAERRKRERDVIFERKLAKEQAEEDAQEDYQGKEKFITKSYKRKLAERELWAKEEEQARLREEQEDVLKKKDGAAFASFYGNLASRNVAMGGQEDNDNDNKNNRDGLGEEGKALPANVEKGNRNNTNSNDGLSSSNRQGRHATNTTNISPDGVGEHAAIIEGTTVPTIPKRSPTATKRQISYTFVDGFEMGTADIQDPDANVDYNNDNDNDDDVMPAQEHQDDKDSKRRIAERTLREDKVAAAIKRYFLRHPDRKELSTSP
eukprot:CAMPEP_0195289488 /NCGR_PEP_ID=MMETSP0707-20130614/5745_1 /TAXON_ID=33640 /ORGANISM="Asterionellopsis glacialis, Strain CCMP134" /LENGTH=395 /DNA_ID=CAMNT_0040349501 /DNA_START=9 /DNA_END=1196 /DNA_ORIENTATION=+